MFGLFKKKQAQASTNAMAEQFRLILSKAFPDGDRQRDRESSALHIALKGLLSEEEAGILLVWTKVYFVTNSDLSEERVSDGIYRHEQGRLTREQSAFVYRHIAGIKGDLYTAADGAVVINCGVTVVGIWAEKRWLEMNYGIEDEDWQGISRKHGKDHRGKAFEKYSIRLTNGTEDTIHFDISQWYLKN